LRPLRLQIGGQTIAGFESPGTGRPILLVHGNSSSSRIWQKQLQGPLGAKYRLIAIDLPGHGASSPPLNPEQDYSGPGYAGCIAAVARELDLKDAVVLGWSLGGHAVLNAAASLPMAAGLMIFGTPPISKTPDCLGAAAQAGRFEDEVEIVRHLKIPLAIVQGGEEQIVDLGYLQRLPAPTLWRGQVQVIEGAGHATQLEKAEAFDKIVDEFASSL